MTSLAPPRSRSLVPVTARFPRAVCRSGWSAGSVRSQMASTCSWSARAPGRSPWSFIVTARFPRAVCRFGWSAGSVRSQMASTCSWSARAPGRSPWAVHRPRQVRCALSAGPGGRPAASAPRWRAPALGARGRRGDRPGCTSSPPGSSALSASSAGSARFKRGRTSSAAGSGGRPAASAPGWTSTCS